MTVSLVYSRYDFLAVYHAAVGFLQFLILTFSKPCLSNLFYFKFQKGEFLCTLCFIFVRLFKLFFPFFVFRIGSFYLLCCLLNLVRCKIVQDFQLFFLVEKGLMLVLSVYIDQNTGRFFQKGDRHCLTIDLAGTPAFH